MAANDFKTVLTTNVITLIIGFGASYATITASHKSGQASAYSATLDRMHKQDQTISDLQAQIVRANIKIINLESRLRSSSDYYIDSIPAPAWIKELNKKGQFVMLMINKAYSKKYGISKRYYAGKRDDQVWPPKIAESFENNDRQVLMKGGSIEFLEEIPQKARTKGGGKTELVALLKFSFELPDGKEGVGGLMINMEK